MFEKFTDSIMYLLTNMYLKKKILRNNEPTAFEKEFQDNFELKSVPFV